MILLNNEHYPILGMNITISVRFFKSTFCRDNFHLDIHIRLKPFLYSPAVVIDSLNVLHFIVVRSNNHFRSENKGEKLGNEKNLLYQNKPLDMNRKRKINAKIEFMFT